MEKDKELRLKVSLCVQISLKTAPEGFVMSADLLKNCIYKTAK
jgi:hypothetical protein